MRQFCLHRLGTLVQSNSLRLLAFSTLALFLLCAAIRSAKLDTELGSWIQRTQRIDAELNYIAASIGQDGQGSNSQLLLQTPQDNYDDNVLTVDSLLLHLEALKIATQTTVDLYDLSWSLKDICFTPTIPDFDGLHMSTMLENIMPCVIKTPLDCFWEGAKLLGPDHPVSLGSFGPKLKWTTLNPKLMVETMQRVSPNSLYPYSSLLDWMKRVGISTGYQFKPCLDPTDPGCPLTAPNRIKAQTPDIGSTLTGGCRGFASNQMHWKEEEIVGGVIRNNSGYIVRAKAIQSTILVMGEQDMYDYWRKTSKVQDVNNWSVEKAKLIIDSWHRKFNEDLVVQTQNLTKDYKINTISPKFMMDPMSSSTLIDYDNFLLSFGLMTLLSMIIFPKLESSPEHGEKDIQGIKTIMKRYRIILLTLILSLYIGLTFIASLGLSSFFNLPLNMASTQILPPLALYYGFNQVNMIVSIYSQKIKNKKDSITIDCLHEMFPIITIESITYAIALLVAGIIPVQATRMFAFQAITFVLLFTLVTFIVVPSIMSIFLNENGRKGSLTSCKEDFGSHTLDKTRRHKSRKSHLQSKAMEQFLEEQIFCRIQEDLRNLQSNNPRPNDIRFSAQVGFNGLQTSFKISTNGSNLETTKQPNIEARSEGPAQIQNLLKNTNDYQSLPDIVTSSMLNKPPDIAKDSKSSPVGLTDMVNEHLEKGNVQIVENLKSKDADSSSKIQIYIDLVTDKKSAQITICLLTILSLVAMLSFAPKVDHGLQLTDIVSHDSDEYEPSVIRETFFPVYNIFAITKGNFDYPANQKLLHEFFKAIEAIDGIVKSEDSETHKFWLASFRDWLLELQDDYDRNRNRSLITSEGWAPDVSDTTKLAYKLLAQTGRADNPVDKALVDSNRLVDSEGIINVRCFYYYLPAWVVTDSFSYANTEAMLKPEPRMWNDNPDDLKVEKARPINYAQIPFLISLPDGEQNLRIISDLRRISKTYEKILPNFPTGIPLVFWDQFINLDYVFVATLSLAIVLIYLTIGLMTSDFTIAAISVIPVAITSLELYGLLGYLSIPFNNIVAFLLVVILGMAMIQTSHLTWVSLYS